MSGRAIQHLQIMQAHIVQQALGVASYMFGNDDEAVTKQQVRNLLDGGVEGQRSIQTYRKRRPGMAVIDNLAQASRVIDRRAVPNQRPLGLPGRTRSEDDISQVVR